eukprot:6196941-Pleurochrysis_carterae.AAC.3
MQRECAGFHLPQTLTFLRIVASPEQGTSHSTRSNRPVHDDDGGVCCACSACACAACAACAACVACACGSGKSCAMWHVRRRPAARIGASRSRIFLHRLASASLATTQPRSASADGAERQTVRAPSHTPTTPTALSPLSTTSALRTTCPLRTTPCNSPLTLSTSRASSPHSPARSSWRRSTVLDPGAAHRSSTERPGERRSSSGGSIDAASCRFIRPIATCASMKSRTSAKSLYVLSSLRGASSCHPRLHGNHSSWRQNTADLTDSTPRTSRTVPECGPPCERMRRLAHT